MADLVLSGLRKSFGGLEVIKGVDLTVDDGEFVVFVGPSGCGKSTTLRLIAGLEDVTSGTVRLGGQDVTRAHPSKRGAAMVFQSYALFPHMTVAENIGFGLRLQKVKRSEINARVGKVAETLQLTELLGRTPRELSGGQRQRVAIGRSIIRDPKIFLFDEPLSNLDAALRVQMRLEIAHLHQRLGATMIYVTHDQVEAMTLADRIIVFNAGQIEQIGTPMDLYARPANRFVAGFIGAPAMNFLPVRKGDNGVEVAGFGQAAPPPAGAVEIGFRPEHVIVDETDTVLPRAQVELVEHLGADTFAYVRLPDEPTLLTLRLPGNTVLRAGAQVRVRPDWPQVHWFDGQGRTLR